MPVILLIGFALVVVVIIAAARGREKANTAWQAAAARFELAYTPASFSKSPSLEGTVSGHPVKVDIETRNRGKGHTQLTRFSVGMPRNVPDLKLRSESFFSKVSQAFGSSDIQVGDADFDEHFNIRGRSAGAIREFLTPRRRQALQRYFTSHPGARLEDGALTWSTQGRLSTAGRLIASIEDMVSLADELSGHQEPEPKPSFPQAPAEVLVPEGDIEAESQLQTDADPESEVLPEPEPEPVPAAPPGADLEQFCSAVFADASLSYQATQAFDSEFKGKRVYWSGILESIKPYTFDFVFGSGKGLQATVQLTKLAGRHIGDGVVRAIVQLPADHALAADRAGEAIDFSGTLVKADGLMRKVFVANGEIVDGT